MGRSLEARLMNVVHEIQAIKKELIMNKSTKVVAPKKAINEWNSLIKNVSELWDAVSPIEEIRQQREKCW